MKRKLEVRLQKASGLLADNRPLKAATPCISKKTLKKHETSVFRRIIPEQKHIIPGRLIEYYFPSEIPKGVKTFILLAWAQPKNSPPPCSQIAGGGFIFLFPSPYLMFCLFGFYVQGGCSRFSSQNVFRLQYLHCVLIIKLHNTLKFHSKQLLHANLYKQSKGQSAIF